MVCNKEVRASPVDILDVREGGREGGREGRRGRREEEEVEVEGEDNVT